jgi:DNA polymerase-3 subunit delta
VFLLTEYIQKNKKEKAVQLVKDLIVMKEEPIKLLALITSNYRLYYQSKILSQKGLQWSADSQNDKCTSIPRKIST